MKHLNFIIYILFSINGFTQINVENLNNQIIEHKGYTLSYNESCEQANWVKYMVTKIDLEKERVSRTNNFREDDSVSTGSADLPDYKGSGYDRGHLAPAADFAHDKNLMSESFLMSNISPQHPSFNRGIWKTLENRVREIAKIDDTVYVITGGVLNRNKEVIGDSEVCVPEYFYKVILRKDGIFEAYLFKNEKADADLNSFKVDVARIKKLTGLKFKK